MTTIILIIAIILATSYFIKSSSLSSKLSKAEESSKEMEQQITELSDENEKLSQYKHIVDAEAEAKRILENSSNEATEMISNAKNEVKEIREKARAAKVKAEQSVREAGELAETIHQDALLKAKEVAGEAWEAKEKADQYTATAKAMKNVIEGYGDEYLIPNRSLLDELADEYDHKEAGQELTKIRAKIKAMIKNGEAADCDYKETYRRKTAIEFALDAFNGKVDTIMSKVKHDNYGKLLQELKDAKSLVQHNGQAFKDARIKELYFDAVKEQLDWAVKVQELKKIDQEEQRAVKEAIREEEKARREYEKAQKAAEKEEKLMAKAVQEAERNLLAAAEEEKEKFEVKLTALREKLKLAEEKGKRALSMAQQTKRGHVYIISNVGSFGEDVYKIGLTRRLEPLDRVKELGDASVPFSFDVHAMIFSEDAPNLEKELHKKFETYQVNKVNPRKEFFKIQLGQIKSSVNDAKLSKDVHWTMKAEAVEYRESIAISKKAPAFTVN